MVSNDLIVEVVENKSMCFVSIKVIWKVPSFRTLVNLILKPTGNKCVHGSSLVVGLADVVVDLLHAPGAVIAGDQLIPESIDLVPGSTLVQCVDHCLIETAEQGTERDRCGGEGPCLGLVLFEDGVRGFH